MLVNFFEIFGIGFGLGLAGPCLFYCIPLIFAFTLGSGKSYRGWLADICIFLCGRLIAYILLSCLAGLSGMLLHNFIDWRFAFYFKPLAGIISIGFGMFILLKKEEGQHKCVTSFKKDSTPSSLFALGFLIGISPCLPLIALLSEIALISKNAIHGAFYGFAFGLGTFIPAFLITAGLTGIFKEAPQKLLKSVKTKYTLKIISSTMLILFGILFILGLFKK